MPITVNGNAPNNTAVSASDPLSGNDLFRVSVDGSNFVDISLPLDAGETEELNGSGLANAITLALNDQFGDEQFFDFSSESDRAFSITTIDENAVETTNVIRFAIPAGKTATTMLPADIIDAINTAMANTVIVAANPGATPPVAKLLSLIS